MRRIPPGYAPDGASVFSQGSGRRASDARSPWLRFVREPSPWKGDRGVASERCVSFPHITLVEFDLVFLQQGDECILVVALLSPFQGFVRVA